MRLTDVINTRQPFELSPSVRQTEHAREQIGEHVAAFLQSGGRIQQVPAGVSGDDFRVEVDRKGKLRYVRNSFSKIVINPVKPDPKGVIQ